MGRGSYMRLQSHLQQASEKDWWQGAIVYQVYLRSFFDSNGDGIGDLKGVSAKLDYIASLGVDGIWISPFFESPMKDIGYDVSNYRSVAPVFGSLSDIDKLIRQAHARGLKVLIDLVLSHTSDMHPWFIESRSSRDNPKADWYVWADPKPDGTPPTNWLSVFGGSAWEWDTVRQQYYFHNFLSSQPDLNFHNAEVRAAVFDIVRFWLERGVDGFRLDTVNLYYHDAELQNNPELKDGERVGGIDQKTVIARQNPCRSGSRPEMVEFLKEFRALLDSYPGTMALGELSVATNQSELVGMYTRDGDKLHSAYSFDFLSAESFSAEMARKTLETVLEETDHGWPTWALSNHDSKRVVTRWGLEAKPLAAATMIAMTASLRGVMCMYQGEECGLPEAEVPFERLQDPFGIKSWPGYKGRDGCRTPMPWADAPQLGFSSVEPWLPAAEEHRPLCVERQEGDPNSTLNRVRRFLNWRKSCTELIRGVMTFEQEMSPPVLAFTREDGWRRTLCLFNLSDKPSAQGVPAGAVLLSGNGFEDAAYLEAGTIFLRPWASAFLDLDPTADNPGVA